MAELIKKAFLDEAGLKLYDELIKAYIDGANEKDQELSKEILETLAGLSETVTAHGEALDVLNGEGEGSVKKAVDDAIAELVGGAPETFDTLKEIADWIESPEGAAAFDAAERIVTLEQDVEELKNADVDLKSYIDAQDHAIYDAIVSIEDLSIKKLFLDKVEVEADASVADALAELKENEMLVLAADSIVAEDLMIPDGAIIDANGATFTGVVKVPAEGNVAIENAVFANPVVVE